MQLDDLKTPGYLPNAMKLRIEAFHALGYAGNMSDMTNKESDTAASLRAFFLDCAKHCEPMIAPVKPAAKATVKETA